MIARFSGAVLALLAFGVATLAGLAAGNPPDVVLARALGALAIFCLIGLAVGGAAQAVVNEFAAQRARAIEHAGEEAAEAREVEPAAADGNPVGTE